MARKNLLLCFDAFGTLFKPKQPIAQQYGEIARQCGLGGFSDEQLKASFRAAFKSEAKAHPNYGRADGMGAAKWWTNIIHKTFEPLKAPGQSIPEDLAPRLLHRFSSADGYSLLEPELPALLRALRDDSQHSQRVYDKLVVGVITNSDDRVPEILSSFGLSVSPLRYGGDARAAVGASAATATAPNNDKALYDVDFHCMSYDVGFEKPDERIFTAAEEMLKEVVLARHGLALPNEDIADHLRREWARVYVGDDYDKDIVGALNAGWNAVLLDRRGDEDELPVRGDGLSIPKLAEHAPQAIITSSDEARLASVDSIRALFEWLMGRG